MESNEAQYLFTESELNALIADERAAEREACAKAVERTGEKLSDQKWDSEYEFFAEHAAKAIRARGQK